ncbi:MAG: hypothetical protein V4496_05315 [Pseudomonadota bacterium]
MSPPINTALQFLANNWQWFAGGVMGYFGKLLQDYLVFNRNKEANQQQEREKTIKEIYSLIEYFKLELTPIQKIIAHLKTNGELGSQKSTENKDSTLQLSRLKYLLTHKLDAPTTILEKIEGFENCISNARSVLVAKYGVATGLISDSNPFQQYTIEKFDGDHTNAALSFYYLAKSKAGDLKKEIEIFLNDEKNKLT